MVLEALKRRYASYPQDHWFTVSFQVPGEAPTHRHYQIRDIEMAATDIGRREGVNVWTTMAVFAKEPAAKGTKAEVTSCAWLWVDMDDGGDLAALRAAKPSVIVASGRPNHWHGYWALTEPCTDIAAVEARLSGLQKKLGSDPACTDASRSLRLPGTVNPKSGTPCTVLEETAGLFRLTEFPEGALDIPILDVNRIPFPADLEGRLKEAFRGTYVMERIYTEASAREAGAQINPETGKVIRYRNDARIARQMAVAGFTKDEVGAVLTHPTWFSGDKGNEVGWNYVTLTVSYAFNSVSREVISRINVYETTKKLIDPNAPEKGYETKAQFNPAIAADSIIERYHVKRRNGLLYYYDYTKNRYFIISPETVAVTLKEALGNAFRMRHVTEVEEQIKRLAVEGVPNDAYINVRNGLLNTETRKLIPHTPDVFVLDQIPVMYNADVAAEAYAKWDVFAGGITSPANIGVLEEQGGFCFTTSTTLVRNPIALIMQGPRSSGKSELLHVVCAVIGEENTAHVDLADLAKEQDYYAWNLLGMRANIRFETSTATDLINTDRVKSLISSDEMEIRQIYGKPVKARVNARFFMATNDAVLTRKVDPALYKRMRILSCTHDWTNDPNRQPGAGQRLANDPDVLSAILNRFLDGLDRLRKLGEFTDTEDTKAAMIRHREDNDSVEGWLAACTEPAPEAETTQAEVYLNYKTFCGRDRQPAGKIKFKQRLAAIFLDRPDLVMTEGYHRNESHNKVPTWKGRRLITQDVPTFKVSSGPHVITIPNIPDGRN